MESVTHFCLGSTQISLPSLVLKLWRDDMLRSHAQGMAHRSPDLIHSCSIDEGAAGQEGKTRKGEGRSLRRKTWSCCPSWSCLIYWVKDLEQIPPSSWKAMDPFSSSQFLYVSKEPFRHEAVFVGFICLCVLTTIPRNFGWVFWVGITYITAVRRHWVLVLV